MIVSLARAIIFAWMAHRGIVLATKGEPITGGTVRFWRFWWAGFAVLSAIDAGLHA